MKDAQRKLSKRYGDANFEDFIEKGYVPQAIINYIALLGWSPKGKEEKLSLEELEKMFDISGISKSPSIFDEQKMKWLNAQYLREFSLEEFNGLAVPFYEKSKVKGKYDYLKLSGLLQNRVEILSEIPGMIDFLEEFGAFDSRLYDHKNENRRRGGKNGGRRSAGSVKNAQFNHEALMEALTRKSEVGIKKGQMLFCVRVALTGKESTPEGRWK